MRAFSTEIEKQALIGKIKQVGKDVSTGTKMLAGAGILGLGAAGTVGAIQAKKSLDRQESILGPTTHI